MIAHRPSLVNSNIGLHCDFIYKLGANSTCAYAHAPTVRARIFIAPELSNFYGTCGKYYGTWISPIVDITYKDLVVWVIEK